MSAQKARKEKAGRPSTSKTESGEENEEMAMSLLDELESQVKAAAERLRSLGDENRRLSARVETLEGELEAARKASSGKPGDDDEEGMAAWAEEREEVRRRLESLTRTLEGLLVEDEGGADDDDDEDADEDDGSEEE